MKSITINADCMEVMRGFADKQFELAIVDPPYGIGAEDFNLGTECHLHLKRAWIDEKPSREFFDVLHRVSKNQIIWGGNYFTDILEPNNNWIVWYKNNAGVSFSMCEMAWSSIRKNIQLFDYRPMGKLDKIHTTQKPVALYRWLLKNYAKPGDHILDTHLGSGSSRIAADEMGHNFTGIELDRDYFEAQERRWKIYKSQGQLFPAK